MIDIKKIQENKSISDLIDFSIINIDKPPGFTSHDIVKKIIKILNLKKAGHFGTLDPNVTGVLPIAINRATRLSNFFMKKDKTYVGKMYLHSEISKEKLEEEMKNFLGKIMQKPPVKSRVKRVLREREIIDFKILKMNKRVVEFEAHVEAGTYIRKLCSDLGEKVGGAHMTSLRRTKAGIFEINQSHTIEEIEEAYKEFKGGNEKKFREILIPGEIISEILPIIYVNEDLIIKLKNGMPLFKKDIIDELKIKDKERFLVFSNLEEFIGVYKRVDEEKIVGRAEFIFRQVYKI